MVMVMVLYIVDRLQHLSVPGPTTMAAVKATFLSTLHLEPETPIVTDNVAAYRPQRPSVSL
jgi:hypothetical protein